MTTKTATNTTYILLENNNQQVQIKIKSTSKEEFNTKLSKYKYDNILAMSDKPIVSKKNEPKDAYSTSRLYHKTITKFSYGQTTKRYFC